MVLTKAELIGALKHEVHILVHLITKIDPAKLDYRPTATQRSTLELLKYLAMMGPTLIDVIPTEPLTMPVFMEKWGQAEAAVNAMNFDQLVAELGNLGAKYVSLLEGWTDEDFRADVEMFGHKSSRGSRIVSLVLGGHAAYRTQLFCYLKSCGRDELGTMDLWAGVDNAPVPA